MSPFPLPSPPSSSRGHVHNNDQQPHAARASTSMPSSFDLQSSSLPDPEEADDPEDPPEDGHDSNHYRRHTVQPRQLEQQQQQQDRCSYAIDPEQDDGTEANENNKVAKHHIEEASTDAICNGNKEEEDDDAVHRAVVRAIWTIGIVASSPAVIGDAMITINHFNKKKRRRRPRLNTTTKSKPQEVLTGKQMKSHLQIVRRQQEREITNFMTDYEKVLTVKNTLQRLEAAIQRQHVATLPPPPQPENATTIMKNTSNATITKKNKEEDGNDRLQPLTQHRNINRTEKRQRQDECEEGADPLAHSNNSSSTNNSYDSKTMYAGRRRTLLDALDPTVMAVTAVEKTEEERQHLQEEQIVASYLPAATAAASPAAVALARITRQQKEEPQQQQLQQLRREHFSVLAEDFVRTTTHNNPNSGPQSISKNDGTNALSSLLPSSWESYGGFPVGGTAIGLVTWAVQQQQQDNDVDETQQGNRKQQHKKKKTTPPSHENTTTTTTTTPTDPGGAAPPRRLPVPDLTTAEKRSPLGVSLMLTRDMIIHMASVITELRQTNNSNCSSNNSSKDNCTSNGGRKDDTESQQQEPVLHPQAQPPQPVNARFRNQPNTTDFYTAGTRMMAPPLPVYHPYYHTMTTPRTSQLGFHVPAIPKPHYYGQGPP